MHLYVIRLQLEQISVSHREVFEAMCEQGISVNPHYIPVHTQPYSQGMGFRVGQFPEAERHYAEAISLPMYPTFTEVQQDEVIDASSKALQL